jgi:hypothetical protein
VWVYIGGASKLAVWAKPRSKTGWTARGRPGRQSASLTGRLLRRLFKLTKTGWTSFENRLNLFGRPVSLSASLLGRLLCSMAKLTKPVEPPLTTLSTCSPVWLAGCWSEVRGVRDQLNCPEKPVQLVLTREFWRENPSSTARRQVQLVYGQRGSLLKLKFSWSWESSTVVEKAQLQFKKFNSAEKAQLQLKKLNSAEV